MPAVMTHAITGSEYDIFTSHAEPEMIPPVTRPYLSQERIQNLVAAHGGLLSEFREAVRPVFEAMLEGQSEFTRRPNVSLRLPAQGSPAAWVLVRPGWDRWRKQIQPSMVAEMIVERVATAGIACDKPLPHVEVAIGIDDEGPRWKRWGCESGEEALERMVGTMAEFLDNPANVFARSANRCCLCGRRLTDELSRGRGIGPECIQKYHLAYTPSGC